MKTLTTITCLFFLLLSCKTDTKKDTSQNTESDSFEQENLSTQDESAVEITPVSHATMVLTYDKQTIFVDPTGGAAAFSGQKKPTIVLITDIHGDHMHPETLKALNLTGAKLVMPQAVADKLPNDLIVEESVIINNGQSKTVNGISIEAIPMYNLREEALKFHEKGRGNGYVLSMGNERVYISGDTEDIPEMRNLENIDIAFVCMNLPYTMTVESAASAVLEFKPKKAYPYHYRGTDGLSDVEKFKTLVNQGDEDIEVVQLNWYE